MHPGDLDWVFAYGSNMHMVDLRRWLAENGHGAGGIHRVEPATLPGYRLAWNYRSRTRNGGAANVAPAEGRVLPGLALLVDAVTLRALDMKEGHPSWYDRGASRHTLRLHAGGVVDGWVYVATAARCSVDAVWPRREYLELLVVAAREHGLPHAHVAELEATPTADD